MKKSNNWFFTAPATLIALSLLIVTKAVAVEFNTDILDAEDKKNIDLSRFSEADYIMPGEYELQLRVNEQSVGQETLIPWYIKENTTTEKGNPVSLACIRPELLEKIGLTEKALLQVTFWHNDQCADFSALAGVKFEPNISESSLTLIIPQAYLEYSDANWVPPSRWDNGIPGLLLDYNANTTVSKNKSSARSETSNINGTVGLNAGAWRLRGEYQGSFNRGSGSSQSDMVLSRAYLFRALPNWQSSLTLGEGSISSDLFSSWNYTGLSLASDERMLPPHLRGYAPEITGIADTNARVTITQQGRILYDSTVPAGPFNIQTIDSSVRGTLDVTITEQNGQVKTSQFNAAYIPYLTRPGRVRYKFSAGQPRSGYHDLQGPLFSTGEISYGLSNRWSLYGGSIISNNYQAYALGSGVDLGLVGTVSTDVTQSVATLTNFGKKQGKSYRANYSKRFDALSTEISFAGYRFAERSYMTMQQYLDARRFNLINGLSKELYTILVNKSFPNSNFSMGLSYNYQTYWDQGSSNYYNLNINQAFSAFGIKNMWLSATATRSYYSYSNSVDDAVFLRLSIPMGDRNRISYSGNYSSGKLAHTVNYYSHLGQNSNYSVTAGTTSDSSKQLSGYYSYRSRIASMNANVSTVTGRYSSAGLSASGGITATAKGISLHSGGQNGSTRLMLDTEGVGGIPIDNGAAITNRWGVGVLTDVNSYYLNTTQVDVHNLDHDVEAHRSVVESVLTEGAIGYRKFEMVKGSRLFAVVQLTSGDFPPFGATLHNTKGREMGLVSESGLAWISGVQPGEKLSVSWDGQPQCSVVLPEKLEIAGQLRLSCQS